MSEYIASNRPIYNNIVMYIFKFIPSRYLPWLRLVCKKWADKIKYRKCNATCIIIKSKQVSINFIKEMEKYFKIVNFKYIEYICQKDYYEEKIQVLKYLGQKPMYGNNIIDYGMVPDIETLEWFFQNYKYIPNKITLRKYSKELLYYHQSKGYEIEYYFPFVIPLKDIDEIDIPNQVLVNIYAMNNNVETMKSIPVTDINQVLLAAIYGKAEEAIKYLLVTYSNLAINYSNYIIHRKDKQFSNFLLSLRQKKGDLIDLYKLPVWLYIILLKQRRINKSVKMSNRYWKYAIMNNRVDICNYLEWNGSTINNDVMENLCEFVKDKRPSSYFRLKLNIVKWMYQRLKKFDEKFVDIFSYHANDDLLKWFIEKGYQLGQRAYMSIIKFGSYQMLDYLKQQGINPPKLTRNSLFLSKRNSSIFYQWFDRNTI